MSAEVVLAYESFLKATWTAFLIRASRKSYREIISKVDVTW